MDTKEFIQDTRTEAAKSAYKEMRLGNLNWLDFSAAISKFVAGETETIKELAAKLGFGSTIIHRYTKSYAFLKKYAPDKVDDPSFKETMQADRIDKLRRLHVKQPEFFEDKDMRQYILDLKDADPKEAKRLLMEKEEGDVKVPEQDIFHTELLVRVVFDKLKEILKDPRAQAELRNKVGPVLHECAVALESVFDPKFAASVRAGKEDLIEFETGD